MGIVKVLSFSYYSAFDMCPVSHSNTIDVYSKCLGTSPSPVPGDCRVLGLMESRVSGH